jgi:hypothetical protein
MTFLLFRLTWIQLAFRFSAVFERLPTFDFSGISGFRGVWAPGRLAPISEIRVFGDSERLPACADFGFTAVLIHFDFPVYLLLPKG